MILSLRQIEDIGAAVIQDFNKFFYCGSNALRNTIELLQGRIQKLEEALASDQVNDSRILQLQQIIADRASKKMEYLRRHYQLFDEKTLSVAVADLERELNQPIVTLKQPQVWKELQELFRQRLDELRKESSEGEETHHG